MLPCAAMQIQAAAATRTGIRERNEDCFGLFVSDGIVCIADGMGGLAEGARASRVAVATVQEWTTRLRDAGAQMAEGRAKDQRRDLPAPRSDGPRVRRCVRNGSPHGRRRGPRHGDHAHRRGGRRRRNGRRSRRRLSPLPRPPWPPPGDHPRSQSRRRAPRARSPDARGLPELPAPERALPVPRAAGVGEARRARRRPRGRRRPARSVGRRVVGA
jgi:hypothetical protein